MSNSLQEQLVSLLANAKLRLNEQGNVEQGTRVRSRMKQTKPAVANTAINQPPTTEVPKAADHPTEHQVQEIPQTEPVVSVSSTGQNLVLLRKTVRALSRSTQADDDGIELLKKFAVRAKKLTASLQEELKKHRAGSVTAAHGQESKFNVQEARNVRDNCQWIANAAQSLVEAASSNDLDAGELIHVRQTTLAHLDSIREFLNHPTIAGTEVAVEAVRLEDLPARHFQKYIKDRSKLRSAVKMTEKNVRFHAMYLPVLAIFRRGIVTAQQLEAEGFEVNDDGGYTTLLNQHVWGINTIMLAESSWEGDELGYVQSLIKQYQRRTGQLLMLCGPEEKQKIGHPSAKGVNFYWLMTVAQNRALPSSIKDWAFPF